MTLREVFEIANDCSSFFVVAFIILASLLEVSKIKVNPWRWLGKMLNRDVIQKVEKIEADIEDVKKEVGEDKAVSSRYRILRFDDELLHDVKHSKEHFDQILFDIDVYEKYCNDNPCFKNNMAVMAIEHIKAVYQKCSRENLFL